MHMCTKLPLPAAAAVVVIYLAAMSDGWGTTTFLPQYLFPPRPYSFEVTSYWQEGHERGDVEESLVKELQVTTRQLRAVERHHYAPFLYRPVNSFDDIVRNFFRRENDAQKEQKKRLEEFYTMNERCVAICMRCMYHMTSLRKNKTFDFGVGSTQYFPRWFSEYMPPGYLFRRTRLG